jgi:iron complex outermembrane recepter protein
VTRRRIPTLIGCVALAHGGAALAQSDPEATVRAEAPRRAASDVDLEVGRLRLVPRGSAAELLSLAPGFYLAQHGGEGKAHQLFLRGFDAQHGQDVEFSVGGLPLNEVSNVHGQGYADLNFVIPEVVDRLHVQEGPFDPRQGDFAVAGSARFDLGVQDRGALARASYGMFNTARAVVVVAPRGERRETFLAGELYRTDGYGVQRAASRASALGQYARRLAGGSTLRALAAVYAARFDSPGVVREDDYARGTQDFFGSYDLRQGGASSRAALLAELVVPTRHGRFTVLAHAGVRALRIQEDFTGFALDPRGDRYEQRYDAVTVGLRASHRATFALFGRTHAVEFGLTARHDRTTGTMGRQRFADEVTYVTTIDADVDATDIGMYADVDLRVLSRLRVRGGVRADALAYQIDDRSTVLVDRSTRVPRGRRDAQGFQVGPRVTAEVDLGAGFTLLGAYGKGFRSPQALSLGDGESAPFAVVHAGEIGARWRRARWQVAAAGFVTHVDRDLIFDPAAGQNVTIPESAATTRAGASLLLRGAPLRGLELIASGTYARATFDATGYLVPYVPPWVGRLDAVYAREVGRPFGRALTLSFALGATALGERPLPFSERSPAVFLLDAAASARLGPVELGVSGRNLTDARWRDGAFSYVSNFTPGADTSRVPVQHFTAGRPLTILGTVTVYL